MRRRRFIGAAASALALRRSAGAQTAGALRRIGVLMTAAESDSEIQARLVAFRGELSRLGWAEGRNIAMEYRWGAASAEARQRFAQELVALNPHLLLAQNTPATAAILRLTRAIPVIFFQASDPIGSGFARSLARPGGNVTGFVDLEASLAGKWVQLLKELAPRTTRAGMLFNPNTATYAAYYLDAFHAAARSFGLQAVNSPVRDRAEIATAMAALSRVPNSGLIVMPEAFTGAHRAEIVSEAVRNRLPAIYPYRYFTALGGLLSYGIDLGHLYARAAGHADRILKGEQPSEIPIEQPTKFELAVNLRTAASLGLTVPDSVIVRADDVIE